MRRYRLRRKAQRDLAEIWLQTADRWGVDQAEDYVSMIRRRIESLLEYPERGPIYRTAFAEFRKMACGHHRIFYLVTDEMIDVVHIVHERRDVDDLADG